MKKVPRVVIKVEVEVGTNPRDVAWTLQDECDGNKVVFGKDDYPTDKRRVTYADEMCLPLGK